LQRDFDFEDINDIISQRGPASHANNRASVEKYVGDWQIVNLNTQRAVTGPLQQTQTLGDYLTKVRREKSKENKTRQLVLQAQKEHQTSISKRWLQQQHIEKETQDDRKRVAENTEQRILDRVASIKSKKEYPSLPAYAKPNTEQRRKQ
jgi:hypothetical protein